ncbi:MAG: SH3 domain-containing protein [Phototrophicaceae bacterium]
MEFYKIEVPNFGVGWVETSKVGLRLGRTTNYSVMIVAHSALELTLPNNTKQMLGQGTEAYLINVQGSIATLLFGDGRTGTAQVAGLVQRTGTTTDNTPLEISGAPVVTTTTTTAAQAPATSGSSNSLATLGQGGGESATIASLTRNYLLVNISYLNARSGPGAQYTIVATLNGGTELDIIGIAGDRVWYYVRGAFGQGWVNSEYVIFRGNPDTVPIIENAYGELATPVAAISSNITLYAAPGTNFGVIGTVVGPVEAPIVARTSDYQWIQINTSVGYGWVQTALVAVRGESTLIPIINN